MFGQKSLLGKSLTEAVYFRACSHLIEIGLFCFCSELVNKESNPLKENVAKRLRIDAGSRGYSGKENCKVCKACAPHAILDVLQVQGCRDCRAKACFCIRSHLLTS